MGSNPPKSFETRVRRVGSNPPKSFETRVRRAGANPPLVTFKRRSLLIDHISLLHKSFEYVNNIDKFEIIAFVILPDHLHMLIQPEDFRKYPDIIRQIKTYFTKHIDYNIKKNAEKDLTASLLRKGEKGIWQRRYYEHTIRNIKDLNKHIDYIHYNPVKHDLVKCVRKWEYSSFIDFVRNGMYDINWGSGDINDIS